MHKIALKIRYANVHFSSRLHAEQRMSIEKQLQSFSAGAEGSAADAVAISNLEEQVKCATEVNIPDPRRTVCPQAPLSRLSFDTQEG